MSQLIASLAGAPQAANTSNSYYQQALNQAQGLGSGTLATTYGSEQNAALQPQFKAQDSALAAKEAAMGITNSGAAKADFGDLASNQSATLAGAIAPLYSQSLGVAGNILGAEPGAANNAYQNAINNFYSAISDASSLAAGVPPTSSPGTISDPYNIGGAPTQQVVPGGDYQQSNPYSGTYG